MKFFVAPAARVLACCILPVLTFGANVNVSVNVTSNLFPVASTAYGMHTSVYDNCNQYTNAPTSVQARLTESGIGMLRYSGGGYADVYHWSVHKMSPWQDGSYGYLGPKTDFGNFVWLLDHSSAQALITINFGSGVLWNSGHTSLVAPSTNAEPQEAAAWVAYANGDASLYGTANDITIGTDSLGNNWRTVGFWAKLRSSTQAQYLTWATAAGIYDANFNLLAINHPTPVGIKYWEIGNETFGTGYYDGSTGYSVNYAVPYNGTARKFNAALSPATYGQQVKLFAQAMRAVDPTIKIGAVVSTPPGDYSWDSDNLGRRWTPEVLNQCASNIDFVIAHWYIWNGNNDNGGTLLPSVAANLPSMINGTGVHAGTSSGLKDWINAYRPTDSNNVSIFITEFGYTGSVTNSISGKPIIGPVNALFAADAYSTWMTLGVSNICFLEMNKTGFIGDSSSLTRGEVFYALKLLHLMANPGDMFVNAISDTSTVRAKAVLQQNGKVGLMLLNESRTTVQMVSVTISNAILSTNGIQYQFGTNNFTGTQETPTSPPTTNSVTGLGNSFSITVPAYTMVVLTIPIAVGTNATTVDLVSGASPSAYGSAVTFTATVKTNGFAVGGISGDTVTFYDGTVQLGTGTVNSSGQATYTTSATQLSAVTHSIKAVYAGDATYAASTNSPALSQTINPATVTAALTGSVSRNYNGTTAATMAAGNYTLSGVVGSDTVTLNNPSSGTFDTRNVGTGKTITVTGLAISGSSATNYSLASTAASGSVGTINKTNITVTAAANTKPYDTTASAAAAPAVITGSLQTGDTATFTESYDTANAGSGKTLTPSGSITDGNGGGNYNLSLVSSANGTITPATLMYTANSASMTYGAAVPVLSGGVGGFLGGDNQGNATSGTMLFTTPATSSSGAGTYAINGSGLSAFNGNYTFAQAAINASALAINPFAASLTGNHGYDGTDTITAGDLSVANKIDGDDVIVASGSGTVAGANLGLQAITSFGTLALGGAAAGNYTLAGADGSVTIVPGSVTTTNLLALDRAYDGTTNATLIVTNAVLVGVVIGENVTLITSNAVGFFADPNAGTNKPVTVTGLALDGDSVTNYVLVEPTVVTATISPLPVTITLGITANSKIFDGTTAATLASNSVVLSGMLGGDESNINLSTNGCTATFAAPDVGTGIAVTVGNLSLTGSAAGNYSVMPPTGLAADILPLLTPALSGISRAAGAAQLSFSGPAGQNYKVLATDDLTLPLNQWTVLTSGTFGTDPVTFMDSSVHQRRFYRIVSP